MFKMSAALKVFVATALSSRNLSTVPTVVAKLALVTPEIAQTINYVIVDLSDRG